MEDEKILEAEALESDTYESNISHYISTPLSVKILSPTGCSSSKLLR